jgi:hypothetical protein
MECERWFSTMSSQTSSHLLPLDFIIEVWYFAQEHGEPNFVMAFIDTYSIFLKIY